MREFTRIVTKSDVLGGKPIIRGTRISVEMILEWIASGATVDKIVVRYPHLSKEAVNEAILFKTRELDI
jgi:uncharacterized protein (DUF433 family)